MSEELKPCPFCGTQLYVSPECVRQSGVFWRERHDGMHHYVKAADATVHDTPCYMAQCNPVIGGCGAEMHADSLDAVIEGWNTRTTDATITRLRASMQEAADSIDEAETGHARSVLLEALKDRRRNQQDCTPTAD